MLYPKLAAANGFDYFVLILQLELKPVKQALTFVERKKKNTTLSEGRRKKISVYNFFTLALGIFFSFFSDLLCEGW